MSDFEGNVRLHLSNLRVSDAEREEVILEITTHLEDASEEIDRENVTGADRERRIAAEIGDWNQLKKGIRGNQENLMRERFRRLWLPALAIGFLAYATQFMIARFVVAPSSVVFNGNYYSYIWQWYSILLLTGALGASWSRRAGGSVGERLLVALAPSSVMAIVFFVVFPIELTISMFMGQGIPYLFRHPAVILPWVLAWVLIPAIPSVLGAAAFLGRQEHAPDTPVAQ